MTLVISRNGERMGSFTHKYLVVNDGDPVSFVLANSEEAAMRVVDEMIKRKELKAKIKDVSLWDISCFRTYKEEIWTTRR